ncbi:MAG TPA: hypothetical protein VKC53_00055 [Patescibacteria group bacterium]|nr:hypothetical protein [Patescibacteria group bacterium]
MSEIEKYLSHAGTELRTQVGNEVVTVAEVAGEALKHATGIAPVTMDSEGRVIFPMEGGFHLAVDPSNTMGSNNIKGTEWYATKDGTVEGKKKINSVEFYRTPDPSKSQTINIENDYNPEKGTVGQGAPLIAETKDGRVWVAVQDADRFGIQYKEGFRRGWSRPKDEAPKVKAKNDKIRVRSYTDEDLGMTNANNARLIAPEQRKAYVSYAMTVLSVDTVRPPKVEGAKWMSLERFMTQTEEGIVGGAVSKAVNFDYIKKDAVRMDYWLRRMPNHVQKMKAIEMAKGVQVAEAQK